MFLLFRMNVPLRNGEREIFRKTHKKDSKPYHARNDGKTFSYLVLLRFNAEDS